MEREKTNANTNTHWSYLIMQKHTKQVFAAADRPARRSDSCPPCCTHVNGRCDKLVTDDHNQFTILLVHLCWQHLRRSAIPEIWSVPPKFKWFTWPNHEPFRDGLPSVS